jgi:hypothetical protein
MKSNTIKRLRIVSEVVLGLLLIATITPAQTTSTDNKSKAKTSATKADTVPTATTTGDDAGDYIITSTIEVGYRGLGV